jgi:D-alanyl-D-alanine carboxypeptidase
LPAAVSEALQEAGIPARSLGIVVQPVDGGPPLLSHNARQAMNPASVMKLVTTYAGLELLGPAHTWRTEILAEPYRTTADSTATSICAAVAIRSSRSSSSGCCCASCARAD